MLTSVSNVCHTVGVLPATLKSWRSASLITSPCAEGYSESQVAQIRVIRALTSSGDTLSEIRTLLNDSWHYRASGWEIRQEEFLFQLRFGTDDTRACYLWRLFTCYSPEDVKIFLLMPLVSWFGKKGKENLRARFIRCLLRHTVRQIKAGQDEKYVKLLQDMLKMMKQEPLTFH